MPLTIGTAAPDFTLPDAHGRSVRLSDYRGRKVALVFTRYAGCPVCQMEVAELARRYQEFKDQQAELLIVLQSAPEQLLDLAKAYPESPVLLSDPLRTVYRLYEVMPSLKGYLAPRNISAIIKATREGFRHGKFEGHELQQPAEFIINAEGIIRHAHYGQAISDYASADDLLGRLKSAA